MANLQVLVGLILSKVEEIHDYIQLVFNDGTTLNIFNKYAYSSGSILGVEGKKIKYVKNSGNDILIVFEDSSSISIGLRDDDYNGPEVMELMQKGKPSVVWS